MAAPNTYDKGRAAAPASLTSLGFWILEDLDTAAKDSAYSSRASGPPPAARERAVVEGDAMVDIIPKDLVAEVGTKAAARGNLPLLLALLV